jgi:membrane-bound serine protease (ClpP class)
MSAADRARSPRTRQVLPTLVRILALVPFSLGLLGLLLAPVAEALAQDDQPQVDVIQVDGTITPVVARYVERAIEDAGEDGRAALVIELDTPGGLGTAMDDIIRDILESAVPVVVYVSPRGARADSAGTFITYAAHVAAMAPGTNIGSASPVFLGTEEDDPDDTMTKKVTNDAVAQIVNLANLRGRNAEWAEQAVREAANVTADEALALDVVDVVSPDLPTLLVDIDGMTVTMSDGSGWVLRTAGAATHDVDMNPFEQFLQIIADPTIAYLLLSIGGIGLFFELANPGGFLPGVVGGLSLLLGLFALGTLPVNWAGLLLMAFGLLLLVVDIYVPSFGALTVGGIISFVIGSYLLIDASGAPGYEIPDPVIWTVTACLLAFFSFLGLMVLRAHRKRPATGRPALLGAQATVRRAIEPGKPGMVFLQGELWEARTEGGAPTPVGTTVVVTAVDGLRLTVRPATAADLAAPAPEPATDPREVIPASGPEAAARAGRA